MTQRDDRPERFAPTSETARKLRDAFGRFATGVTVITTQTPDGPVGMTANSFSSVSLDPALVLWCIDIASDRFDVFNSAQRYAIHVLSEDQQTLSNGFAADAGFFDQTAWTAGPDDVPDIHGCLARFDCEAFSKLDAGDHVILVGKVREVAMAQGAPLLFAGGGYGTLSREN